MPFVNSRLTVCTLSPVFYLPRTAGRENMIVSFFYELLSAINVATFPVLIRLLTRLPPDQDLSISVLVIFPMPESSKIGNVLAQ